SSYATFLVGVPIVPMPREDGRTGPAPGVPIRFLGNEPRVLPPGRRRCQTLWPRTGALAGLVGGEEIAGAADRLDEMRFFGVCLDLPAQPGDPDIDAAVERLRRLAVREIQQLIARQDAVGVRDEGLQQVEFHAGQADRVADLGGQPARREV